MPKSRQTKLGWTEWIQLTKARFFLSRGPYRLSSRDRGFEWLMYETGSVPPREIKFPCKGKPAQRLNNAQAMGNIIIKFWKGIVIEEKDLDLIIPYIGKQQ